MLAGMYVVAFVAMVAGLAWTLYNQVSGVGGTQVLVGVCIFVAGQLAITSLAFGLRARVSAGASKAYGSGYHVLWQRLSLGKELGRASRLLRGV
jgi:ABC-type Na+ efflux pump permease subunit